MWLTCLIWPRKGDSCPLELGTTLEQRLALGFSRLLLLALNVQHFATTWEARSAQGPFGLAPSPPCAVPQGALRGRAAEGTA